ncbi:NeuD/PglB/VioB family sugar acetyltransferase [Candidatus Pelagibacter ubique]|nr:NeuD/PglB/VioB family sugar acetyltransferase [Candidatus Pelagibacter ubique]
MYNVLIIGTGGHSKVVSDEIGRLKNYKVVGYIDERKKKGSIPNKFDKAKVLGKLSDLKKIYKKKYFIFIAIGDNYKRKKIFEEILKFELPIKWAKIISKNSIVSKNAKILEGTIIISGAIINTNTNIGKHCIINTGSKIDHDNHFDDFSSCGPNVTTGGNVVLKSLSFVGIGSTIKHNIKILDNTVIGGKSYVNKNCEKNCLYFGRPIKKIKIRKLGENYL